MKIKCSTKNNHIVMQISGEIDSFTSPIFFNELDIILRAGNKKIILYLKKCDFINLQAIKFISKTLLKLKEQGGELFFYGIDEKTSELIGLITNLPVKVINNPKGNLHHEM